jgi:hypothetical protein
MLSTGSIQSGRHHSIPINPLLSVIVRKLFLNGQVITTYYEDRDFIHGAGPFYREESGYWIKTSRAFEEFDVAHKMGDQKHERWATYDDEGNIKTIEWYQNGELVELGENEETRD